MTSEPTSSPDPTRQRPEYSQQPYLPPRQYGQPGQQRYSQQPYGQQPQYGQQQYGQQQAPQHGPPQHGPPQYGAPPGYPPQYGQPAQGYGQPGGHPQLGYPQAGHAGQFGELADWVTRAYSLVIDAFVPSAVYVVLLVLTGVTQSTILGLLTLLALFALIGFTIWNSCYRQGTTGQSLGKQIAGTKLVSLQTGQPVGFGLAFGRQLAHTLEFGIGYLWPLWDEQRQTFADKICSTIVVRV